MHDEAALIEARIERVLGHSVLWEMVGDSHPFEVEAWEVPGEPVTLAEALDATFTPFAIGSTFSRPWGTTWFRLRATVPTEWEGRHVQAEIGLGFTESTGFTSEGLLWRRGDDGEWHPWKGIHPASHHVTIGRPAVGGEVVDFLLEATSNPTINDQFPDPNSDLDTAGRAPIHRLHAAQLIVRNDDVHGLVHDISVARDLMRVIHRDQPRRYELLQALSTSIEAIDLGHVVDTAPAARAALADVLAKPAVASAHRVSAIGHAHMDTAWLWPLRETRRKCARTFANVLRLMDEWPEMMFACSQAAQYEWMLDDYPDLFAEIGARVADGRWVPVGGMWVEADANLSGGEALLRQFVHGQRFFREHFGVTCTETWLPDVFGYPASLPGIMSHAGIERFLTQKLSWNRTNRFPHHTFWWEGIDGSTVFTHFPPVETYNAIIHPVELDFSVRNFADRGRATRSLMPFGWGDGGGGPSPDMMEMFRRTKNLEGLPRLEIESPAAFFDAAMAEYPDAARWVGELYFEMHRGTFTSQARTKLGNRRSELLLREAELWAATAAVRSGDPSRYPADELDRIWKTVLTHQFHDILPGSSIGWVHREAEATYADVAARLEAIIADSLGAAGAAAAADAVVAVANAAPHARREVAVIDAAIAGLVAADLGAQPLSGGAVAVVAEAPALGVGTLVAADAEPVTVRSDGARIELVNEYLRAVVDAHGGIISLVDRVTGREMVPPGSVANRLEIHPDLPNTFDAWDIEHFNRAKAAQIEGPTEIEVCDDGPLVARVRVTRRFRSSSITQTIELRSDARRLDIANEVEWAEREQLLQVAFPLDLHSSEMTREIQFGHLATPTHTNTSWDFARFEVCAHRWVDVSESGAGMALLNDCKYGHHAERGRSDDGHPMTTLYLTLLRGSQYPDPKQDLGHHRFTYSLVPHSGDFRAAGVIAEGYRLNLPLRAIAVPASAHGAGVPLVTVDNDAVVVEAVKLADDGSGDVIVRCYESFGGRAVAKVSAGFAVRAIVAVDAHESADTEAALPQVRTDGGVAVVALRPFQIATLRLHR